MDASARSSRLVGGRYAVRMRLGAGGCGEVYEAVDTTTQDAVAIKFLAVPRTADAAVREQLRKRFRREIAIGRTLRHPAIARVLDEGRCGELDYCVFELAVGETLRDRIAQRGAQTVRASIALMAAVLEPVLYAHARGITHRDLKPSNIMVLPEYTQIRLLDFGLSSIPSGMTDESLSRLTLSRDALGTPAYAAPEQLRGALHSGKADLYSWALVFVECLTGQSPIAGASLAEIFQHQLADESVPLPAVLRDHPLGILLRWCLEKDPTRRAGDAVLVRSQLRAIQEHELAKLEDGSGHLRGLELRESLPEEQWPTRTVACPSSVKRWVIALAARLEVDDGTLDEPRVEGIYRAFYDAARRAAAALAIPHVAHLGSAVLFLFPSDPNAPARLQQCIASLHIVTKELRSLVATLGPREGAAVRATFGAHAQKTAFAELEEQTLVRAAVSRVAQRLAEEAAREGKRWERDVVRVSRELRGLLALPIDASSGFSDLAIEVLQAERERGVGVGVALVGRERELTRLLEAYAQSLTAMRCVLVLGEAGIGKSRMIAELVAHARQRGSQVLTFCGVPEHEHVPLAVVVNGVRRLFALDTPGVDPQQVVEEICEQLGPARDAILPELCARLELPLPSGLSMSRSSPQLRKRRLLDGLRCLVSARLGLEGGVLVFEDLHFFDASSLALVSALIDARSERGLVVMTARPGTSLVTHAALELLELTALPNQRSLQLARQLATDALAHGRLQALPSDAQLARASARAQGNPLFLEELVHALDAGWDDAALDLDESSLPTRLRLLLARRLDELGAPRELAEAAACLGRHFELPILSQLVGRSEGELLPELDVLQAAGLLSLRQRLSKPRFAFRHFLVRDAIYESIEPARRRALNEAVACVLREQRGHSASAEIARAAELAGEYDGAAAAYREAATFAVNTSSFLEAVTLYERACRCATNIAVAERRERAELAGYSGRCVALMCKLGCGAPDVAKSFERVRELAQRLQGVSVEAFFALKGAQAYYHVRPELDVALTLSHQLAQLARASGDLSLRLAAQHALCQTHFARGEFNEAILASQLVTQSYNLDQHGELVSKFGDDPLLVCLSFKAFAWAALGKVERAKQIHEAAVQHAHQLGFPSLVACAFAQSAWLHMSFCLQGDPSAGPLQQAESDAAAAIALSRQHEFPFWEAYASSVASITRGLRGDPRAIDELTAALAARTAIGAGLGASWEYGLLARFKHEHGDPEGALDAYRAALAHSARTGEHHFDGPLGRIGALLRADAMPNALPPEFANQQASSTRAP